MSRIVRIAARGEGVTEDGRFVPLAAPGDVVRSDGAIEAGPSHAIPPCRHFPECGGCQLQHVSDDAYRAYLVNRVADALKAQGLAVPDILPPYLSPPRTRRRASLRAERGAIGFNEAGSNRIIDMRQCEILAPPLFALVAPLRALISDVAPPRARAIITMTEVDQGVDLTISGFEVEGLRANEALAAFGAKHALARLSVDEGFGPTMRTMPQPVTITLSGVPVAFPEGAFLQATRDGEAALIEAVRPAVADAESIIDLFSGLGTFALALPACRHAVEGGRDAALALKGTGRVAVEHRDLFRRPVTSAELCDFDAVVLDPPRAGAKEQVVELAKAKLARVAYVSCNPATFARDAATLAKGGFELDWVQPVGQFRWSTHVELVGAFARAR